MNTVTRQLKETILLTCECGNEYRWNPNYSSIKPKRCSCCENTIKLEKQKKYAKKQQDKKRASLEEQRKASLGTGGRGAETIHANYPRIRQPKKQIRVKSTINHLRTNKVPHLGGQERSDRGSKRTQWTTLPTNELIQYVQQNIVNPYIRLRDKAVHGNHCISCNDGKIEEAGHFYSIGSTPELRFFPENIHGQCHNCNSLLGGNLKDYHTGLIARQGQRFVHELHKVHANAQKANTKLLRSDILEIAATYKYLRKNSIWVFTSEEFEEIRKEVNEAA